MIPNRVFYISWKSLLIWSAVAGINVIGQRLYCPVQKKKIKRDDLFFFIRNFHPKRPNYSFGPHTFVTVSIQSLYIYGKSIVFIPKLCMKFIFCPWTLKSLFFVPELWKNSFLHMNFFILKKSSGTKFMCKNELFKVQGRKSNFIQSLGMKTIV